MHEISLVRNIFHTLEAEFPQRVHEIRGIYLKVGLLANIQPILMQNAFEAVLEDEPQYKKAKLYIEMLPILVYCEHCKKNSEVHHYSFKCSYCKQPCAQIVQGEELLITKVEFEETCSLTET